MTAKVYKLSDAEREWLDRMSSKGIDTYIGKPPKPPTLPPLKRAYGVK